MLGSMSAYELAQLNIGIIRGPMDSPVMAGFVWRLQTEAGDATAIRPFENENQLLNMSVWQDLEQLRRFVYRSAHAEFLRRRREGVAPLAQAYLVLWWVPRGHRPSVAEAIARLETLRAHGPGPEAFT